MAAQSPLARFFTPAAKKVGTASPPQTPAPKLGDGKSAGAPDSQLTTPPSASEARKRTAAPKGATTKKPRAASKAAGAVTPQEAPGGEMPEAERQEEEAQSSAPEAAPVPAAGPMRDLRDLRATLQQAQRSKPGSLPAFTAECFHHYESSADHYSWPKWLQSDHLRDADGKRPTEPGYNQSTLLVPSDKSEYPPGHNTPMLMQYWAIKAKHFDKVALFKVGKFYEVFYYDAFIAQRTCNLKWMGQDKKPHVGFPEMAKHDYARKIVEAGFKVVVVEQVERVIETNQRKSDGNKTAATTCVERDACEVYTSGTLVDPELLSGAGARFMVYLHFEDGAVGLNFSACLVDCATSQIQLGRIADGADRNALRTLLAQVQPSEVVYDVANLPVEVMQLLKRLPCRPQLSPVRGEGDRGLLAARDRLNRYRTAHPKALPKSVEEILGAQDSATMAAAGVMDYLQAALLGERVLPFAIWEALEVATGASSRGENAKDKPRARMVLDATALSALEIVENLEGAHDGSLLAMLDHTSTPFGYRLLKQWVCAPLCDLEEIRQRQDSVEFLLQRSDLCQQLRVGLKKCIQGVKQPVDLERATSRIWSYALQAERKAVMYDNVTARRLGQFYELLNAYDSCLRLFASAFPAQGCQLPGRLAVIAQPQKSGGCLPDLAPVITRLRGSMVEETTAKETKKYRPQDGADPQYDDFSRQIKMTIGALEQELETCRKNHPKVQFAFVHRLPGFRYEVECDEQAIGTASLQKVDVTYRSKGKVRFHTKKIKELLAQLDKLEDQREDCIFPFLSRLFRDFHAHQAPFRAALRCVSELDVLLSLALASRGMSGASCKPEFEARGPEEPAFLELKSCRHPVAAEKMGSGFVPNDTSLNTNNVPGMLVVTGPNMGGKSTVLRQTCLAVVMAQLGCWVNAERCRLAPIDRIFTRIGAYDAVLEGKSTLLTELEETAAVLAHGTPRSLAVLDELGRGTSTFDGAAIASAVLDELKNRVGCLGMFATHYHPVSREHAKDTSKVAPFHMAAAVDPSTNQMTFLYKFLPGLCPASHGHHVAKIAGLPAEVLEEALRRSAEFEFGTGNREEAAELTRLASQGDESGLRSMFRKRKAAALGAA
eukprot:CAMPEP_0197623760 /NCGR_PEP_ID=MMETSP1338-20131121/3699_1 /TAXON_ID=43686 ORGANISM="Pelagodinium beii, Strain RCC1491" /NCGR_SAMPLE_ID=MMETSP1338 /ASSEMBLY_ACC=CAM_ASM_000754 /LENGTH=1113 /DNA_ID=CAMNT_0043193827 /DNA_START=23 /DNA_END=3364 /DNA_ORIENTATION=+